jgi:hypothetical protein
MQGSALGITLQNENAWTFGGIWIALDDNCRIHALYHLSDRYIIGDQFTIAVPRYLHLTQVYQALNGRQDVSHDGPSTPPPPSSASPSPSAPAPA